METKIISSGDSYKELLDKLNRVYPSEPFERYSDLVINSLLNKSVDMVLGESYNKRRISKRKSVLIEDDFRSRVQGIFGKWANIHNFKIHDRDIKFKTNVSGIYRNNRGRLYSLFKPSDLYITSHCLDRFEERLDTDRYNGYFTKVWDRCRLSLRADPTSLDILRESVIDSDREYSIDCKGGIIYYKTGFGILVIQSIEDIYVALTFLLYEMVEDRDRLQWKKVIGGGGVIDLLGDFLKLDSVNIVFFGD